MVDTLSLHIPVQLSLEVLQQQAQLALQGGETRFGDHNPPVAPDAPSREDRRHHVPGAGRHARGGGERRVAAPVRLEDDGEVRSATQQVRATL